MFLLFVLSSVLADCWTASSKSSCLSDSEGCFWCDSGNGATFDNCFTLGTPFCDGPGDTKVTSTSGSSSTSGTTHKKNDFPHVAIAPIVIFACALGVLVCLFIAYKSARGKQQERAARLAGARDAKGRRVLDHLSAPDVSRVMCVMDESELDDVVYVGRPLCSTTSASSSLPPRVGDCGSQFVLFLGCFACIGAILALVSFTLLMTTDDPDDTFTVFPMLFPTICGCMCALLTACFALRVMCFQTFEGSAVYIMTSKACCLVSVFGAKSYPFPLTTSEMTQNTVRNTGSIVFKETFTVSSGQHGHTHVRRHQEGFLSLPMEEFHYVKKLFLQLNGGAGRSRRQSRGAIQSKRSRAGTRSSKRASGEHLQRSGDQMKRLSTAVADTPYL